MKRATAAAWGRSSTPRFGKAHTDGSDAGALGSERGHQTRIHAAGQQQADRNVGNQVLAHNKTQGLEQLFFEIAFISLLSGSSSGEKYLVSCRLHRRLQAARNVLVIAAERPQRCFAPVQSSNQTLETAPARGHQAWLESQVAAGML